jgi:hypothetical protein
MKLTSSHISQKQKYEIWTKLSEKQNQQLRQKEPKSSLDAVPLRLNTQKIEKEKREWMEGNVRHLDRMTFFWR